MKIGSKVRWLERVNPLQEYMLFANIEGEIFEKWTNIKFIDS